MSNMTGDGEILGDLEIEIEAELNMAESSRPEEVIGSPISEWLFDPMDVEREEVGLRNLLDAVEAIKGDDSRNDDRSAGS